MSSRDVTVSNESLRHVSNVLLSACALVRNTKPENYSVVVNEFVAWVSDYVHRVKLYLDSSPMRAAVRAPHCTVHDEDDVVPGRVCGRPLPCSEHGAAQDARVLLINACQRLIACKHALAYAMGKVSYCPQCGAVRMQDSGWAVPIRLLLIESMLKAIGE
jgi:hypothetical protein